MSRRGIMWDLALSVVLHKGTGDHLSGFLLKWRALSDESLG